ncbi:MAG: hypothetical protein JWN83_2042 [Chitinophagaceae bacterium]|nr:hypothetical protein [Chitinophagaceae bacterium]
MSTKEPIINCHTHIFTGDHVPPYLAKKFVPPPFHLLLPLRPIVAFFRWWYKGPAATRYTAWYKKLERMYTRIAAFFTSLYPLNIIAGYYIFFFSFFILYNLVMPVFPPDKSWLSAMIHKMNIFMSPAFPVIENKWIRIILLVIVFVNFETIRNFIFFVAKMLWKALGKLPGKQTKEMFSRYLNIGRYAFHKEQSTIFSKLRAQYPGGTGFVILPMDMDYMEAGNSTTPYRYQMERLAVLKHSHAGILYPFVFADPRRFVNIKKENRSHPGDKPYFQWHVEEDKVVLDDCFLKQYIEDFGFSGIKIYPALGYYPFDERLLPLWKYAADNKIPVLTHCIRGTIFYRGEKKKEWNEHPVFKQAMGVKDDPDNDGYQDDEQLENRDAAAYEPLVLPQSKNVDFSVNFTHPLNYLCLLEEELLRKIIMNVKDPALNLDLKNLFGYNGPDKPMSRDLHELKICMGHFGGEDEWKRYFEKDRDNYSSQLSKYPAHGISFLKTVSNKPSPGKPEQVWKFTDWYSIICSMILQYPNVYADISYILHGDAEILPLLKQTLQNPGLREKVLYGTDFFVVRNHKSDKNMLADMMGGLTVEDFDQIARTNPAKYLKSAFS